VEKTTFFSVMSAMPSGIEISESVLKSTFWDRFWSRKWHHQRGNGK